MTPDLLFLNIFLTGFLTRSLSRQLCLRAAAGWPSSAYGCEHITVPLGLFGLSMPHSFLSWDKSSLRNSSILRVPWISPSVACPCSSGYLQAPTESLFHVCSLEPCTHEPPACLCMEMVPFSNTQSKRCLSHEGASNAPGACLTSGPPWRSV